MEREYRNRGWYLLLLKHAPQFDPPGGNSPVRGAGAATEVPRVTGVAGSHAFVSTVSHVVFDCRPLGTATEAEADVHHSAYARRRRQDGHDLGSVEALRDAVARITPRIAVQYPADDKDGEPAGPRGTGFWTEQQPRTAASWRAFTSCQSCQRIRDLYDEGWRPQRDSNPCFGLERATS
jgi:hypothetical protein